MRNKAILIILALIIFALPAFAQSQITCAGSTTVLPIAQATAEAFMDKYPQINISIRGGGSGVGIASLMNGTVDIANASRPMKSKELADARSKGMDPKPYALALDAIAVITHKSNPVKGLSIDQIKDIYTGKITNWSSVGGPKLPIVVISRDVSSGTFEVFNEKALEGEKVVASAQLLASNNAIATTVGTTPGGIGYIGLGYLTEEVKAVSVDGIAPSRKTAQDESYKLSRKLYMYTDGKAKGAVNNYIAFIQSEAGQKIVEEQGFIALY
ncbi:MAG: PstS family phosphate ABC transporter substrate-binding protein [Candidatus Syntrophosphaera sp.]